MPRQARKPCSGWGRRSRISSHSAAVAGPIVLASWRMRSTVQSAYRRWLDGMCSGAVVCRWLPLARRWTATSRPLPPQGQALENNLDGTLGQPHLDFAAGIAIRHAVEMTIELDMVIDADPTETPLGKAIGLCRQRVEVRPIELFEHRSAGDPKPPDRALVIKLA